MLYGNFDAAIFSSYWQPYNHDVCVNFINMKIQNNQDFIKWRTFII